MSDETINNRLDALFERWILSSEDEPLEPNGSGKVIFTKDGLMNKAAHYNIDIQEAWQTSSRRVLFLLKDQPSSYCNDARDWLRDRTDNQNLQSRFMRNLANVFWGLWNANLRNLCTCADLDAASGDVKECFNKAPFAFVECKKQGGGTSISNKVLKNYLNRYSKLLNEEIEILNPNIIVCTSPVIFYYICNQYFKVQDLINVKNQNLKDIRLHKETGTVILCSYHPSYWRKNKYEHYERVMSNFRAYLTSM